MSEQNSLTSYRFTTWQKVIGGFVTIAIAYIGYVQAVRPVELQDKKDFDLQLYSRLNDQISKLTIRQDEVEELHKIASKKIITLTYQNTILANELAKQDRNFDQIPLPIWEKDLKGNFLRVNKAYEVFVLDELNSLTGSEWDSHNIIGVNQAVIFKGLKDMNPVIKQDLKAYRSAVPLVVDDHITVEGKTFHFPMCIYKSGNNTVGGIAIINFNDFDN